MLSGIQKDFSLIEQIQLEINILNTKSLFLMQVLSNLSPVITNCPPNKSIKDHLNSIRITPPPPNSPGELFVSPSPPNAERKESPSPSSPIPIWSQHITYVNDGGQLAKCISCKLPAFNPFYHGPCLQLLCKKCCKRYPLMAMIRHENCPKITTSSEWYDGSQNNFVCSVMANVTVQCPNKGNGCNEIIKRNDLRKHFTEGCEYTMLECNKCKQKIKIKETGKHESEDCPERVMQCKYCQVTDKANIIKDHDSRADLCKAVVPIFTALSHPIVVKQLGEQWADMLKQSKEFKQAEEATKAANKRLETIVTANDIIMKQMETKVEIISKYMKHLEAVENYKKSNKRGWEEDDEIGEIEEIKVPRYSQRDRTPVSTYNINQIQTNQDNNNNNNNNNNTVEQNLSPELDAMPMQESQDDDPLEIKETVDALRSVHTAEIMPELRPAITITRRNIAGQFVTECSRRGLMQGEVAVTKFGVNRSMLSRYINLHEITPYQESYLTEKITQWLNSLEELPPDDDGTDAIRVKGRQPITNYNNNNRSYIETIDRKYAKGHFPSICTAVTWLLRNGYVTDNCIGLTRPEFIEYCYNLLNNAQKVTWDIKKKRLSKAEYWAQVSKGLTTPHSKWKSNGSIIVRR
jgi:hypothetical protein